MLTCVLLFERLWLNYWMNKCLAHSNMWPWKRLLVAKFRWFWQIINSQKEHLTHVNVTFILCTGSPNIQTKETVTNNMNKYEIALYPSLSLSPSAFFSPSLDIQQNNSHCNGYCCQCAQKSNKSLIKTGRGVVMSIYSFLTALGLVPNKLTFY